MDKAQIPTFLMIIGGAHGFFGALGIVIGLLWGIIPLGFCSIVALGTVSSVIETLSYGDFGYVSYLISGLITQMIVAAILALPSVIAVVPGAIGVATAYAIFTRQPWAKYIGVIAAIDSVFILGIVGILLAVGTIGVLWHPDTQSEFEPKLIS